MTGTIKDTRNVTKGFGFIVRDDGSGDLFFHKNALQGVDINELKEGDKVSFDIVDGRSGRPEAANVKRA